MRNHWCGLLAVVIIFLVIRIPLCLSRPGRTDEDWFAAPGWTVAREGVPRIPYAPSRDPRGFFYRADVLLFALPPAYFYWQAPWYHVFSGNYGTARLASVAAGVIALVLAHGLGMRILGDSRAVLWGVALYSWSRLFFIPATTVRPDILCTLFGLATLLVLTSWHQHRRRRLLLLAGGLIGAGGLTHPFALVYALQAGLWTVLVPGAPVGDSSSTATAEVRRRGTNLLILAMASLAVFSLWSLLIARAPQLFWTQFGNNVLHRHETPLLARLAWPWPSFRAQFGALLLYTGPIQLSLMFVGTAAAVWGGLRAHRGGTGGIGTMALLSVSAVVILVLLAGPHPTPGYWSYPGAMMWLCCGWTVSSMVHSCWRTEGSAWAARVNRSLVWGLPAILLLLMLRGSEIRLWSRQIVHWNDSGYQRRQIVGEILADLPRRATLLADRSFVFDIWTSGRNVTLGENAKRFFVAQGRPYDFLIINPAESREELPAQLNAILWRSYGDCRDPFAICARVYKSGGSGAGNEGQVVEP